MTPALKKCWSTWNAAQMPSLHQWTEDRDGAGFKQWRCAVCGVRKFVRWELADGWHRIWSEFYRGQVFVGKLEPECEASA